MTDRELGGCALSEVLALLEKATPGEWRWSENGNIVTEPYADNCEVGYIYTEHEDDDTEPANSAAICASVNFLRQHGPALLSRTPGGEDARPTIADLIDAKLAEGDKRDAARYRWLRDLPDGSPYECIGNMPGDRWDDEIDAGMKEQP